MNESKQKRSKTQDPLILDDDADLQSIEQWLMRVNSQNEAQRDHSISTVLLKYPHTLVERLLPHFSNIELFKLISKDKFMVIRSLSELIRLGFDDWASTAQKLFMFSRRVFMDNKSINNDEQLHLYWMMLETSIKQNVLKSLHVDVFSEFFTRVNDTFTIELIPYLDDKHWLGLLAYDDFALCRQLINTPDIALTLTKLQRLLKNRFTEPHKAILLACLKNAIVQNCYEFFEKLTDKLNDYIKIAISFNQFELLIMACQARNPDFLMLLLKNLVYYRRETYVLVATWLSIELNALQTENDHLRNSIFADLGSLLQEHALLANYGAVKDTAALSEAKARILKVRSSQLPEQKKRALLAMLTMQNETRITAQELHQHLLKRSSKDQFRCFDDRELIVTRVLNEYLGYQQREVPLSQLSQHNDYEQFKATSLKRFDSMREKTLELEVPELQAKIARFWASDIERYRRIIMPRPTSAEYKSDVINNIVIQVEKLSPNMPIVWLDSLDLETWTHTGSPHLPIPGMNEHFTLAKALLSRWDLQGIKPMLFASVGFFVQTKGNMTPFIHVPIRFPSSTVVKTTPNVDLLTEETDQIACEHPLRMFIDYLLNGHGAVSRILKQGFNMERRANITRVIASTFDAHTNTMPCTKCLEYAAEIQRSGKLLKVIEKGLKDLSIHYVKGNMPMTLLFRFSLLSMTTPANVNLLEAEPESTLTPPNSQPSPSAYFSKKNQRPDKENISTLLMANVKEPKLIKKVHRTSIQEPEHFTPRCKTKSNQNVRALCANSAVFHELKVPRAVFAAKSSSSKDYTGLIGSCVPSNK